MKLNIKRLTLGQMGANCYIIDDKFIVDPGAQPVELVNYLEKNNIKIEAVLLTHGHFDHIGAVDAIVEKFNCPVYLHSNDHDMFYNDQLNLSNYYSPLHLKSQLLNGEDVNNIANYNIEFINLPGHSHGSSFILFKDYDVVFSGDVLFKGSIGRYDFPQSSVEETKKTIQKMYSMTVDYKIYPGHGDDTTLFEEKHTNPFFN